MNAVAEPGLLDQAARAAVRRLWRQRAVRLVLVSLLFLAPLNGYVKSNPFLFGWALCSAMVGLSMNVLAGYAGQVSLAQAALFGTGAFTIGALTEKQGVPWLAAFFAGGVVTALVALAIGFPALRIRGLNLAIATLGFQFAMQRVIFRAQVFGGASGVNVHGSTITVPGRGPQPTPFPKLFGFQFGEVSFLWFILSVLVVLWMIDRNLTRSRAGRAFFALRQDEQVASSFGIPVARYKLLAFMLSGFYAGMAGALFGTILGDVTNESFDYIVSIEFLVFAVLGGLGSRAGTAIGSAFPVLYRQIFQWLKTAGAFIGGLLLVATLLRYQGGIAEQGREFAHVAKLFAKRGPKGIGLLLAATVLSAGLGFGVPQVIGLASERLAPVLGYHFSFTSADKLVFGLGIATVAFQVLLRLIGKRFARGMQAVPVEAVTLEAEEAIVTHINVAAAGAMNFRRPGARPTSKGPLLEIEDVSKVFGGVRALDGVTLDVRDGELIGIMGPNGSGKTTLLNCISGFLAPNGGDIRFRGQSILKMPPHDRAALGLGRTFQNVGLVKQETVADNFLIAQHLVCNYGAMEGLVRTGAVVGEERRLRMRAHAAIELLGLTDMVGERVGSLPHGLAKLVELGCALVTGPELLLLDEPAAGVSPQEADALGATLKGIAANFGVTVLMIEHHVPLMLSTCDYIYVLNFGQLLTHGEPGAVAAHPDVIAAYLGSFGREASLAAAGGR